MGVHIPSAYYAVEVVATGRHLWMLPSLLFRLTTLINCCFFWSAIRTLQFCRVWKWLLQYPRNSCQGLQGSGHVGGKKNTCRQHKCVFLFLRSNRYCWARCLIKMLIRLLCWYRGSLPCWRRRTDGCSRRWFLLLCPLITMSHRDISSCGVSHFLSVAPPDNDFKLQFIFPTPHLFYLSSWDILNCLLMDQLNADLGSNQCIHVTLNK